jgi:hypothetical protein
MKSKGFEIRIYKVREPKIGPESQKKAWGINISFQI